MTRPTPAPHRRTSAAHLVVALALLAGCSTSGLSPRETVGRDYSSYVYALYDEPAESLASNPPAGPQYATLSRAVSEPDDAAPQTQPLPPARLMLPTKLGVAQIGEVAPPQAFLKKLRDQSALFTRVESVSGIAGIEGLPRPGRRYQGGRYDYVAGPPAPGEAGLVPPQEQARQEVGRMRRFARDMGLDHLLVVGGTIDHAVQENGLGILDLTIVGAFVVPSKEIKADARAAAALIDLKTGRVVMTASADASKGGLASSATRQSGQLNVLRQARDEVVNKLAVSVVAQCRRRQGDGV